MGIRDVFRRTVKRVVSRVLGRPEPPPRPRAPERFPEPRVGRIPRSFWRPGLPDPVERDSRLSNLVREAFFNRDLSTGERFVDRVELRDYLHDEYDLDFDEWFDWEVWRDFMGY